MTEGEATLAGRLAECYSGVVYDAMRELGVTARNVLSPAITLLQPDRTLAGPVFTVEGSRKTGITADDSLLSWTRLLSAAPSQHVVVCQPNDDTIAHMGELSAETLKLRGVLGYVVDGGTRDSDFIMRLGFPTACRYTSPVDIVGKWSVDTMGEPIEIHGVRIESGDLLVADRDGVVVVPREGAADIVARAEELMQTESDLRRALLAGDDPVDAYLRYGVF